MSGFVVGILLGSAAYAAVTGRMPWGGLILLLLAAVFWAGRAYERAQ